VLKFIFKENHLVSQKDLAAIITKDSLADLNRPLAKMDIFYPGSITSLNHRARAGCKFFFFIQAFSI
jgi:hypothetical protein